MGLILIVAYYRLAGKEERKLSRKFGEIYREKRGMKSKGGKNK